MKKYLFLPLVFIWLGGLWLIQLPTSQSSPAQETIQLTADMDVYVNSWSQNTNYGAEEHLNLSFYEVGGSLGAEFILLHFDLSSIPAGAVIDSASLKLYQIEASWAESVGVTAYYVNDRWSEQDVTWANRPTHQSIGMYQIVDSSVGEYKLWNLTSYARNWHSDSTSVTLRASCPRCRGSTSRGVSPFPRSWVRAAAATSNCESAVLMIAASIAARQIPAMAGCSRISRAWMESFRCIPLLSCPRIR